MNDESLHSAVQAADVRDPNAERLSPPEATVSDAGGDTWPAELEYLQAHLERVTLFGEERRQSLRTGYRHVLRLHLVGDPPTGSHAIWARTLGRRSLRFFSREQIPTGRSGSVVLILRDGKPVAARCRVLRVRRINGRWCEGALGFAREELDVVA